MSEPRAKRSKVERARKYLVGAGAGISREDSDDELGLEDHPWEWIYADARPKTDQTGENGADASVDVNGTSEAASPDAGENALKRRKTLAAVPGTGRRIIGARMGTFSCYVGDCLLLKAEGTNEAWVGLVCEFEEDEEDEEKGANFMWFSTEKEIRNKEKRRIDFMPVGFTDVRSSYKPRLTSDRTNCTSLHHGTSTL